MRVKHKLVIKAYFAVAGETLNGQPIQGEPLDVGDLRMLVVNLPLPLPSVRAPFMKRPPSDSLISRIAVLLRCGMGAASWL